MEMSERAVEGVNFTKAMRLQAEAEAEIARAERLEVFAKTLEFTIAKAETATEHADLMAEVLPPTRDTLTDVQCDIAAAYEAAGRKFEEAKMVLEEIEAKSDWPEIFG